MKTVSFALLSILCLQATAQSNNATMADALNSQDIEVKVDGKSYAVFTAAGRTGNENEVAVNNLRPGAHVIRLIPVSTNNPLVNHTSVNAETTPAAPENEMMPVSNRINLVQKQIILTPEEKNGIKIDFYDNGIIDNDTISVYRDDRIVFQNKKVSGDPITFITNLAAGQKVQRIKMEAQNLGTIAPNTALMIVTTSKSRYTIPLTGDLSRNAVVEFLLKE